MSKATLAATLLLGVSVVAHASDLPSKTILPAAPVKKAFSWDGMYVGGSVSYAIAKGVGNADKCDSIKNITVASQNFGDFCTPPFVSTLNNASNYTNMYVNNTDVFHGPGDLYLNSPRIYQQSIYWAANGHNVEDEAVHWNDTYQDRSGTGSFDHNKAKGQAVGAQIGVNKQSGWAVFGLEFDLKKFSGVTTESWEGFNNYWDGTVTYLRNYGGNFQVDTKSRLDWMTTLRGRLGLALGGDGRLLSYITGGGALAVVGAKTTADNNVLDAQSVSYARLGGVSGSKSFVQAGWVVGGGLEYALTDAVSIGTEFQYTKLYGQKKHTVHYSGQYEGNGFDVVHKAGFDSVRTVSVKLNFHF